MWCGLYGFLIIKLQTTLYYAVRCTVTCNAMQCSYIIFRVVLEWFLRFHEHPFFTV